MNEAGSERGWPRHGKSPRHHHRQCLRRRRACPRGALVFHFKTKGRPADGDASRPLARSIEQAWSRGVRLARYASTGSSGLIPRAGFSTRSYLQPQEAWPWWFVVWLFPFWWARPACRPPSTNRDFFFCVAAVGRPSPGDAGPLPGTEWMTRRRSARPDPRSLLLTNSDRCLSQTALYWLQIATIHEMSQPESPRADRRSTRRWGALSAAVLLPHHAGLICNRAAGGPLSGEDFPAPSVGSLAVEGSIGAPAKSCDPDGVGHV